MPDAPITIAIDGPSGSGKSSVSKAVARELGLGYLDTGAMYRALAWWCLEREIDLADQPSVAQAARELPLVMGTDPDDSSVRVGGTDVGAAIRETRISEQVSAVATNLDVRAELRRRQRELIEQERRRHGGVVVEGRDITTVVAPDAEHRILVTASEDARLSRRATELHGAAAAEQLAATHDQVVRRDRDDATVSAFFEPADGVVGLDTSDLTFEQSVRAVLDIVHGAVPVTAAGPPDPGTPHTPDAEEHR
ncbi:MULTISPECIES: (d)CMP kinase [unclassified Ornithinimicrobium]|uniref:(d)CMP kinase n=1 Tax=unclassified Ornithinimicrobium TaxID=2615080 RepID=UPI0038546521